MLLKNSRIVLAFFFFALIVLSSPIKNCKKNESGSKHKEKIDDVKVTDKIQMIDQNLRISQIKGNYGLDEFINRKGISIDKEIINFLKSDNLISKNANVTIDFPSFGCSSFSVPKSTGNGYYFGRNYDWMEFENMIMLTYPENGYSSISTICLSFLKDHSKSLTDEEFKYIAAYLPVDGMNDKGLTVSVNMIGVLKAEQDTVKPDLTTTTAVRLLLDKASTVEEAKKLLESYDLHQSFGAFIHFAITDAEGNAIVVEYIDNKINYIDSPINENFILTPGELYGSYYIKDENGNSVPKKTSQDRYQIIKKNLEKHPKMTREQVRDTLSAAQQEITSWSVIFDKEKKEAYYYNHLNYSHGFHVKL